MSIFEKIRIWMLNWCKNFILNNIDKNQDGTITADEVLDFAQDLIDIYEDITGEELGIVIDN
jgi:regulator of sigma D